MTDETEVKPEVKQGLHVSRQMLAAVVLVLIIAGVAGVSYITTHPKEKTLDEQMNTDPTWCHPAPNERCPSEEWLKSYDEFQAEQEKLKQYMKNKGITQRQRELAGWAQDLAKGIPTQEGYSFDEKRKVFTKPVMPPNANIVPSPTPTPVPPAPPAKK